MSNDAMTPSDQVAMHEQVEDTRRVLLARNTEESYAVAAVLSHLRGSVNARLRAGQPVGLAPHALRRACVAILAAAQEPTGTVYAARWPADAEEGAKEEIEVCETREAAERVVSIYRGPELVQAVRGPWIAVTS